MNTIIWQLIPEIKSNGFLQTISPPSDNQVWNEMEDYADWKKCCVTVST